VLFLTRQVKDGDFESAFVAFRQAGDEARAQAEESLAGGHRESARQAYLWAQNFYDSATYFVDGSADPSRFLPTWETLYDCWLKSIPLWGGAGATARGYDCLTFDGPGQGYALWKQKLYFRPDWEKVITSVVDFALSRTDVDPKRVAIQGISQGGYWVPRAVAFEKRIAAAIADPGVVDVFTSWTETLPETSADTAESGPQDRVRFVSGERVVALRTARL
jgi:hypothetical protein